MPCLITCLCQVIDWKRQTFINAWLAVIGVHSITKHMSECMVGRQQSGSGNVCRIIRQVVGELDEDLLHAFLLLSIFPASFSTFAAAEVLGLAGQDRPNSIPYSCWENWKVCCDYALSNSFCPFWETCMVSYDCALSNPMVGKACSSS